MPITLPAALPGVPRTRLKHGLPDRGGHGSGSDDWECRFMDAWAAHIERRNNVRTRTLGKLGTLGAAVAVLSLAPGCYNLFPGNALWGTWNLTYEDANLNAFSITFDRYGEITFISYQIGEDAVVPVYSPIGVSSVIDNTVTISVNFGRNALIFIGEFNEDQTVITGGVTTVLFIGVPIGSSGEATLTKVTE